MIDIYKHDVENKISASAYSARYMEREETLERLKDKLLEEAQTFQEHRKDHLGHYFAFVGYLGGRKIKVVVRSKTMQGEKFFYSVMIVL